MFQYCSYYFTSVFNPNCCKSYCIVLPLESLLSEDPKGGVVQLRIVFLSESVSRSFSLIVESCHPGQIIMLQLFLHLLSLSQNSSRSAHSAHVYCYPIICFTITCTVFQVADVVVPTSGELV